MCNDTQATSTFGERVLRVVHRRARKREQGEPLTQS